MNLEGQPFSEKHYRVRLKGTKAVWALNLVCLTLFPFTYYVILAMEKRRKAVRRLSRILTNQQTALLQVTAEFIGVGWRISYRIF